MTHNEVMQWHAYACKHGGLPLPRLNFLLATIATMTNNAHGGKATLHDFLPGIPQDIDTVNDADTFMKKMGF